MQHSAKEASRRAFELLSLVSITGIIVFTAGSCSTGKDARVIERESGQAEVVAVAKQPRDATIAALDKAQQYCKDEKKRPVFPDSEDIAGKSKGSTADQILKTIPGVSKVLENNDTQVTLAFQCR